MTTIGTSSSQNGSNNVVPPVAIPLHNTTIPHGKKSEKFAGENNRESIIALDAWKHSNFLCKNYILNALDNTLYGVYSSKESAKELWNSLETKYKIEDARTKKFIIDFKNYLKHKRKEMNLEELIVRLRIEEDNRKTERRPVDQDGANFVEIESKATNKKRKAPNYAPQRDNFKKAKKSKGICYNWGKTGHRSSECRKPKKNAQAHIVANITLSDGLQEMSLFAALSECNMIGNTREWWIDTGATRHVCADKGTFSNYQELNGE
ncbi:uncharacterized protein LOC111391042 [Olea europaea var. sylvestris]|uniref:uncharacterized protein LOC111391042 n=1 Tax=Olea europaea var. sylvestris TaxID=158386 RepID=UPI000C1CD809|nr:uncharacterized protein LOC111391042 [Olea europaea var. sylvestris]